MTNRLIEYWWGRINYRVRRRWIWVFVGWWWWYGWEGVRRGSIGLGRVGPGTASGVSTQLNEIRARHAHVREANSHCRNLANNSVSKICYRNVVYIKKLINVKPLQGVSRNTFFLIKTRPNELRNSQIGWNFLESEFNHMKEDIKENCLLNYS